MGMTVPKMVMSDSVVVKFILSRGSRYARRIIERIQTNIKGSLNIDVTCYRSYPKIKSLISRSNFKGSFINDVTFFIEVTY